jgi:ferric-dicitrate binding protein FerR (iron transport regulator)
VSAAAGLFFGYQRLGFPHASPRAPGEDLWLEGPKYGAPTRVELGGGAHLDLLAGTRARVHRLEGGENRVTLEGGVIEVLVSPSSSKDWSFYAGPYLITTTGSEFFLNYQPAMGTLEVGVRAGQTSVNGGHLGRDSLAVGEGQRLTAGGGSVTVGTLHREDPSEPELSAP